MKLCGIRFGIVAMAAFALAACSATPDSSQMAAGSDLGGDNYVIGAGDSLQIFVRNNPDLSVSVPVRPDGRISVPMVQDVQASGKTPAEVASVLEESLAEYVRTPTVTVMVTDFVGTYGNRIRIVGAATQPLALPYRKGMTALDAIIAAGGLNRFAAGNRAKLVRREENGESRSLPLRLSDLLEDGDMSANRPLYPGDVLVIPETYF